MNYTTGLLYDTEKTCEAIGAQMHRIGLTQPFLEALTRIEALPDGLTRDEYIEALTREGASALEPFKNHPGVRDLMRGFGLDKDDIPFLGMTLLRMVELGKWDFFREIQN